MSKITNGTPGFVYVLTSDSALDENGQPLLKIGATTKTPRERAKQLSAATAAPTPFHVVYSKRTADVNAAEAEAHRILDSRRVNDSREFFQVSIYEACQVVDMVCGGFSDLEPKTPWAELFNSFGDDDGSPRELTSEEKAKCRELARSLKR